MDLEKLYKEHAEMVFNLAVQYVQSMPDAEEIVQDVFLSVHHNKNKFKEESSVKTWIYRITINKSLDFIKGKNRKKRKFSFGALKIDDVQNKISDFNHPGIELEQKEALSRIFEAINQLNENQKTVIILLKIEGLKATEVAQIMNLSPKAVNSLFQRAKLKLKEILGENEEY